MPIITIIISVVGVFLATAVAYLMIELKKTRQRTERDIAELATAKTTIQHLQEKLETQRADLEQLTRRFTLEFENLATRILKVNSAEFAEQSRSNLGVLIAPLQTKLGEFREQIERSYKVESDERITLKTEIKQLADLNKQLGDEARQLAKALKSDSKQQGCWGELVLEKILESSGLRKDHEYRREVADRNAEDQLIRPDVVLNLPDANHLIIDSKVSLTAYIEFTAAPAQDQSRFLTQHLQSLRSHVKGLSEKHYPSAKSLNAPDFVLMFVPVESSFALAVKEDPSLLDYAWERKVIIVSPSTLLAALRTIAAFWKGERQTQNTLAIADAGGALYDKFVGFCEDMQGIGAKIDSARQAYDTAMNKLVTGNGNIIRRVEHMRELGANVKKTLPASLLEQAGPLPTSVGKNEGETF